MVYLREQFVFPATRTATVRAITITWNPVQYTKFILVCMCVFGHKIKLISINFPQFLNTYNYSLVSDKLKALTLKANITQTTRQSIQLHPNESN